MFGNAGTGKGGTWGAVTKSTGELLAEGGVAGHDQTSASEKEMQASAFAEIVTLLLSAGYFRARIAGLSDFDKAVGGLCWAITSSGADVDVDILFQENSTIGEKVQLSEKIVAVTRKMGCPHTLQANQIQGSDWANVYPVIVWLVKKFFENRELTQQQLRKFAHLQFSKNYALPDEVGATTDTSLDVAFTRYQVERRFRRTEGMAGVRKNTEESRVHSALLEYGETLRARYGLEGTGVEGGSGDGGAAASEKKGGSLADQAAGGLAGLKSSRGDDGLSAFDRKWQKEKEKAMKAEQELAKEMAQEETVLLQNMQEAGDQAAANKGKSAGLLGMGASTIAAAAAAYEADVEATKQQLEEKTGGGSFGVVAAFKRQKGALERQIEALEPRAKEILALRQVSQERMETITKDRDEQVAFIDKIKTETQKLTQLEEESSNKADLGKLKNLVMLNESLKRQQDDFKKNCKRQMENLKAQLAETATDGKEDDEEMAQTKLIEDMHVKLMAKYNRLRQLVAERNQHIANNMRLIDDIPTRTELIQYERRFVELYQQVALKLQENKKYFEHYNMLDDKKSFMEKEVKLINSISTMFEEAMKSKQGKAQYLEQFQNIIKGVEDNLMRKRSLLESQSVKLESQNTAYTALVEEQRRYFKAVKDFQEECNNNERLTARCTELGIAT